MNYILCEYMVTGSGIRKPNYYYGGRNGKYRGMTNIATKETALVFNGLADARSVAGSLAGDGYAFEPVPCQLVLVLAGNGSTVCAYGEEEGAGPVFRSQPSELYFCLKRWTDRGYSIKCLGVKESLEFLVSKDYVPGKGVFVGTFDREDVFLGRDRARADAVKAYYGLGHVNTERVMEKGIEKLKLWACSKKDFKPGSPCI